MAAAPSLAGIGLPELQSPAPRRLVRNIDTTFSQEIFDIAKAEGKSEIRPDDMVNYPWRQSMAGIGRFLQPTTVLRRMSPLTQLL